MSRLSVAGRPWVIFDPTNREHRRWYAQFERSNSWGRCPVRFMVTDNHGDLLSTIRAELIAYYTNREFNNEYGVRYGKCSGK